MSDVARLLQQLERLGHSLATCESLTGGLLGDQIVTIPGASAVYLGGFITYNSRLKIQLAGVDETLVKTRGVVTEEVASQMALGTQERLGAHWAIATTGVAGPDTQDGQPVGSVWLAIAGPHELETGVSTQHLQLFGDRETIRSQTAIQAFQLALQCVLEYASRNPGN